MALAPLDRERRTRTSVPTLEARGAPKRSEPTPRKPADGVAARSAASPAPTADADSARSARVRMAHDPVAAQLRARAARDVDAPVVTRSLDPGAPGGPTGPAGTARIEHVDPVQQARQEAVALERELSEARQALGQAQQRLEQRNLLQKGWDWLSNGDEAQEEEIEQLQGRVDALEAKEARLPQDAVERARFTVFNERLAELEATQGKGAAAQLARQTYYNSGVWNGAAGTPPATPGQINAAGFPRGEYNGSEAVGGFGGEMRDPDGNPVDMGHVACALDWQVNAHRLSGVYGNPFDANAVTISGDVASAMVNTPIGPDAAKRAREAIAAEGDADWNGDIDGQNLAHRLASDPGASLTDTVRGYYGGDQQRRIDEWATHSKYVRRDEAGVPLRDPHGNYQLDRDRLQGDAHNFANLLSKGAALIPGNDYAEREVVDAFGAWLRQAQAAQPASN